MTNPAAKRLKPFVASAAVLLASTGLSGCFFAFSETPGVPLDELDMSGAAPTEIGLAGPDDVILTVGEELAITVEGDDSVVEDLRFDLNGKELDIGRQRDWSDMTGKAVIRITMTAPREIDLAGSGTITAPAVASDTEISIAGSGRLTISEIAAGRMEIDMAGSGEITGAGTVERLEISSAGSSTVSFAKVNANDVEISTAGSANIDLASDGSVKASMAGSGKINVVGDAKCELDSVGSGSLNCKAKPAEDAARALANEATDEATGEEAE
ncbi:MAG: head GIN domain-containing protein [Erythrobacter sp.]